MPAATVTPEEEKFILELLNKFENCTWKKGDRVEKTMTERGDMHLEGDKGTLVGGMNVDNMEGYLVHFDNDADHIQVFTIKQKLKLI